MSVVNLFDTEFAAQKKVYAEEGTFADFVYKYRKEEATEAFAKTYLNEAKEFYLAADQYRKNVLDS